MKRIALLLVLSATALFLSAQNSDKKLLDKLVEKQIITAEEAAEIMPVEDVDKHDSNLEKTREKINNFFNNTPYLRIGGYGMLTYRYNNTTHIHHNADVRVLFLSAGGKLTNNFGYFIMGEFVNPALTEYYAEWTPSASFNLRGGQFKVPLSLENPLSLTVLETIYNARSISSLTGMADDVLRLQNGKNNLGRDLGIQASGAILKYQDRNLIQYALGIFQGSGINSSELNNAKDFAGTIMISPIADMRVGGGAYFGQATYKHTDQTIIGDHVRNRWILSADYGKKRFYSRVEWLHGNDGGIESEGLYGLALWYPIPRKLNIIGKVDYFNKNKKINSEVIDYTFGANYYFYNQCRIQLNYCYSDYSKKWAAKNNHLVAAQLQIVF